MYTLLIYIIIVHNNIVTDNPLTYIIQKDKISSMKTQEKFGKRLKELRLLQGISQEKFAQNCNLDRTYINGVENGKRNISIENIGKIVKALSISLKDFFDSKDFNDN